MNFEGSGHQFPWQSVTALFEGIEWVCLFLRWIFRRLIDIEISRNILLFILGRRWQKLGVTVLSLLMARALSDVIGEWRENKAPSKEIEIFMLGKVKTYFPGIFQREFCNPEPDSCESDAHASGVLLYFDFKERIFVYMIGLWKWGPILNHPVFLIFTEKEGEFKTLRKNFVLPGSPLKYYSFLLYSACYHHLSAWILYSQGGVFNICPRLRRPEYFFDVQSGHLEHAATFSHSVCFI